jgi:hypothetical protein
MDYAIRQQRAAVNTEYVLLMICAALAVTLGVSVLGNAMLAKHIQVAEALSAKTLNGQQVAGELVVSPPSDAGDGTYLIDWSGGTPPFTITDGTGYRVVDGTTDSSAVLVPEPGSNTYIIGDEGGQTTQVVITESLGHAAMRTMGGDPRCAPLVPNDFGVLAWFAPTLATDALFSDWSPLLWTQDGIGVSAGSTGGNLSLGLEPDPDPEPAGYPGTYKRIGMVVFASATGSPRELTIKAEAFDVVGATGSFDIKDQSFIVPADGVARAYRLVDVPAPTGWDWTGALPYRDVLYVRLQAGAGAVGSTLSVDRVYMDYVFD